MGNIEKGFTKTVLLLAVTREIPGDIIESKITISLATILIFIVDDHSREINGYLYTYILRQMTNRTNEVRLTLN